MTADQRFLKSLHIEPCEIGHPNDDLIAALMGDDQLMRDLLALCEDCRVAREYVALLERRNGRLWRALGVVVCVAVGIVVAWAARG